MKKNYNLVLRSLILSIALSLILVDVHAQQPPYFQNEFYDLNDNQVPSGWQYVHEWGNASLSNGRLNSYVVDAMVSLKREGTVPANTSSFKFEWDGNLAYTIWGMTSQLKLDCSDDISLTIYHQCARYNFGTETARVFLLVNNDVLIARIIPLHFDDYHYEVTIDNDLVVFEGYIISTNELFFSEVFDLNVHAPAFHIQNINAVNFKSNCTTQNNNWLDNISIAMEAALEVDVTASPMVICGGQTSQLTTLVEGGNGPLSYSWISDPPGYTSNLPNPVVSPTTNTTYTVTVSDNSNFASASIEIEVNELPVADAGEDATIYIGYPPLNTQLSASGGQSYLWSPSIGLDDPLISNPIAQPEISTNYTVTVIDGNGCVNSDDVFVEVIDVRCGNNNNKVLVCKVPPGNPAKSKTICVNPNAVPAMLNNGSYLGPCDSDKSQILPNDEYEESTAVKIFPNPFSQNITIEIFADSEDEYKVFIADNAGRLVDDIYNGDLYIGKHKFIWNPANNNSCELSKGLYYLVVKTTSKVNYYKLLHN